MVFPYVVSGDIDILLSRWARQKGFVAPSDQYFRDIRKRFHRAMVNIFENYQYVSSRELLSGTQAIIRSSPLPTISLDRVYYLSQISLDVTRTIDDDMQDADMGPRQGFPPVSVQIDNLKKYGFSECALYDDVVYTGGVIEDVCALLLDAGITVKAIYAGIIVGDGGAKITENGRHIECVRWYDRVVDEVCERDFFPGVSFSGRTVKGEAGYGIPYILPFGKPDKWASIPAESQKFFSEICIDLTIDIMREIGRKSSRSILCSDIDRKIPDFPSDGMLFVDALNQYRTENVL